MIPRMSNRFLKIDFARMAAFAVAALIPFFAVSACTQSDDGPISVSGEGYEGEGFFRKAVIDSGALIHLVSDTLYLDIDSLWTYSDCALKAIEIEESVEGESFVLSPKIVLKSDGDDCPSPSYHSDTTLKILLDADKVEGTSVLRVRNDEGRVLDTAMLRRGRFDRDTFAIYIDSLFDSAAKLPLRTKDSPSVLKVLDSITPRVFYWRPMESECSLIVDNCGKVVNDTIFPTNWSVLDTVLVPIRKSCALGDSTYCSSTRWKDDSTAVGKVQERADTLWHTSLYYIEKIPECATVSSFRYSGYVLGDKMTFARELMVPDDSETSCGPSALKDVFIFDLGRNMVFPDTLDADSLVGIWKSAKQLSKKKK